MATKNKEAAERQRVAVACTASQNAVALLIAAGWDMRADDMTPLIPTMSELSECDFTFFETDWRTTSEYALQQVGPTTFTGKTGWIGFSITFRDAAKVNVGCLTPMNYWRPPPGSGSGGGAPAMTVPGTNSTGSVSADGSTSGTTASGTGGSGRRRRMAVPVQAAIQVHESLAAISAS